MDTQAWIDSVVAIESWCEDISLISNGLVTRWSIKGKNGVKQDFRDILAIINHMKSHVERLQDECNKAI